MTEDYLADLDRRLRLSRRRRAEVMAEVRDHLADSSDALRRSGLDEAAAAHEAMARFGDPGVLAAQFNERAGTAAMRARPVVGVLAGVIIGVSCVCGARATANAHPGPRLHWLAVVAFQVGVVAAQIALVAGVRIAARVMAGWSAPTTTSSDRALVTRASRTLAVSLGMSALGLGLAVGVVGSGESSSVRCWLAVGGIALGGLIAMAGLWRDCVLTTMDADDPVVGSPPLFVLAERTIEFLARRRVEWLLATALVAGLGAMSHAETTVVGALPWGIGEAAVVVLGFVTLGPALGLTTAIGDRTTAPG